MNDRIKWLEQKLQQTAGELVVTHDRILALEEALQEIEEGCRSHSDPWERIREIARAALVPETYCDVCGRTFHPGDDVVLMGLCGNFHQACFLRRTS